MFDDVVEVQEGNQRGDSLVLAYKTLGVVFGGLVTSPLYVYPSMPLKHPTEDDYLGIYSIMFWTLTLIGVVKYANVAIRADDHGEGTSYFHSLSILIGSFRIMFKCRLVGVKFKSFLNPKLILNF